MMFLLQPDYSAATIWNGRCWPRVVAGGGEGGETRKGAWIAAPAWAGAQPGSGGGGTGNDPASRRSDAARDGIVAPKWGIDATLTGNVAPFWGITAAFFGTLAPFWGIDATFFGNVAPFWGNDGT